MRWPSETARRSETQGQRLSAAAFWNSTEALLRGLEATRASEEIARYPDPAREIEAEEMAERQGPRFEAGEDDFWSASIRAVERAEAVRILPPGLGDEER